MNFFIKGYLKKKGLVLSENYVYSEEDNQNVVYVFDGYDEYARYFIKSGCSEVTESSANSCIIKRIGEKIIVSKSLCDQVITYYRNNRKALKLTKRNQLIN